MEPLSSLPPSPFQGFRQFFKGGNIYLKALDAEDASYLGGSCFPGKSLKKEHSEMLFPEFLEPKNQFPREGWSSLKLSLESKILNEIGQLVGEQGGGNGSKLLK